MQLKKTSNKTAQPAPLASGVTPSEETTLPAAKTRAARSSKKKNESGDMTSATHHHKAAPMPTSQSTTPVSSKPADKPSDKPTRTWSQHDIASLAYSYWVERDFAHGSHEEDWLRAEKELRPQ